MHMHSLLARLLPLGALILACATLPSAAEDLSTEDPAAALEKPAADHATIVHDLVRHTGLMKAIRPKVTVSHEWSWAVCLPMQLHISSAAAAASGGGCSIV